MIKTGVKKNPRKKAKNEENWKEANSKAWNASKKKYKKINPKKVAKSKKEYKKRIKSDLEKQIDRFRLVCQGPIFTCICCMRDLFQRSVEEIKGKIEQIILKTNKMYKYLNFEESLKIKNEIHEIVDRKYKEPTIRVKKVQQSHSLCRTCTGYLQKSEMPPMSFQNSLTPAIIPDCLKELTNLEKQLIVKNLVFIKVRQLPKTRMAAMNDR